VVESRVIRFKAHEASFRQDRDRATADKGWADAVVTTGFDDGIVQNSSRRVIARIWVVQGEIGVRWVTTHSVPMNHSLRRRRVGRMLVMHMERRQQRERPQDADSAGRSDESDRS
jgi:hypothetical protein